MAAITSPENMWIKFFSDAGLPSGISATYALTFIENRIQMNMLLDLNKEYLTEMGITCMGDVIAILRHAKHVHEETARDRVLNITAPQVPIAAIPARPGTPKSITPATRLLEHFTRNSPVHSRNPSPTPTNANIRERLGNLRTLATKRKVLPEISSSPINDEEDEKEIIPIKVKKTHVTQKIIIEDPPKKTIVKEPQVVERKLSDVFARLGSNDEPKTKISIDKSSSNISISSKQTVSNQASNVFARLGGKNNDEVYAQNNSDGVHEPLKYKGVLKSEPMPKKIVIKTNGATRTLSNLPSRGTMQADKIPIGIKDKLSSQHPQRKSVKFSPHVDCKLIEKSAKPVPAKKSFINSVVLHQVKSTPIRNVHKTSVGLIQKNDIKKRLGDSKPLIINSNKHGVFSRLGLKRQIS